MDSETRSTRGNDGKDLGRRPRLKSFAPLVLRSAAPKARHALQAIVFD